MENLDNGFVITKAQEFWSSIKKGFIGCPESVLTRHGKTLNLRIRCCSARANHHLIDVIDIRVKLPRSFMLHIDTLISNSSTANPHYKLRFILVNYFIHMRLFINWSMKHSLQPNHFLF